MDEDPLGSDRRSVLRRRVERSLTPLRPRLSAVRRRGLPHLPRPDHELAATGGAVRLRQDVVRRLHGADRLRRPQQRRVGAVRAGAGAAGGLPGALRHHQRDARRFAQPADTARRPRRSGQARRPREARERRHDQPEGGYAGRESAVRRRQVPASGGYGRAVRVRRQGRPKLLLVLLRGDGVRRQLAQVRADVARVAARDEARDAPAGRHRRHASPGLLPSARLRPRQRESGRRPPQDRRNEGDFLRSGGADRPVRASRVHGVRRPAARPEFPGVLQDRLARTGVPASHVLPNGCHRVDNHAHQFRSGRGFGSGKRYADVRTPECSVPRRHGPRQAGRPGAAAARGPGKRRASGRARY